MLPLGLSTWIPSLRINTANSLVWISGALVFNSLLFLPLRDAMTKLAPTIKTRFHLLLLCWACSAWQALDGIGLRLFLLDRFTAALYLRAYAPSFIAGVLLASLHEELANTTRLLHVQSAASLLSLLLFSALIYVHTYIPDAGWQGIYLRSWVQTGLYMPLICMLIFGATRPRTSDPVAALFGYVLAPLSHFAPFVLVALFFEQPLYGCVRLALDDQSEWVRLVVYVPLVGVASVVFDVISRPIQCRIRALLPDESYAVYTTYAQSGRTQEEYPGVRMFVYYGSLLTVVVMFCMAQLFDPWVNIVDVSEQVKILKPLLGYCVDNILGH
jgi:hypothetical protein